MTSPIPAVPLRGPRAVPIACVACLVVLLAGCGADRGVLARVGGQAITEAQFLEVARDNTERYPGPPDSAKVRLLGDLVDRELLVQGALSEGLDQTPEFQVYRRQSEDQALREAVVRALVGGPFEVSDAEVRQFYDRRDTATRARMIVVYDGAQARQAADDLKRGEEFTVVADRYNPSGMLPPGGDLGFVLPGSLVAPLDDVLREGVPGQWYGPIDAGTEGWFLVRIEERRPESQPPFEEVRARLAEMLRQRKQRAAITHAVERLRRDHEVEVVPGAAQVLSGKLRPVPGAGAVPETPPPPGPEDRAIVLARLRGGTYTLGEAYDELIGGQGGRIDFAVLPTVERWILSQTVERAALAEARRRRLDQEPDVRRRVRERVNNRLLDAYYQLHVLSQIQIEPEDLRAAYERHGDMLARLRSADLLSVLLADSAAAASLAVRVAGSADLHAAAAAVGAGPVAEETVSFPAESPLWSQFEGFVARMKPGESAGPFRAEGGWLVFQLRAKSQPAPSFDELSPSGRLQLQGLATEMKREVRLQAVTDSLRTVFAPVVFADRLRRVPWPAVPGSAGG